MPTHLTNHTVVVVFAISLHGVGDVSDSLSGLGYGYALVRDSLVTASKPAVFSSISPTGNV